ncbi:noggin-like [Ylistrum balloti]|uniref:noggin-like n=1 Tax=Ylistrum balloti TaxID=509963 RepID=UPI002905D471|nr:noggin-like [Ylistrum balloti]
MKLRACARAVLRCVVYLACIIGRTEADREHWNSLQENDVFSTDESVGNSIKYHNKDRPVPSDDLPVIELIENPDNSFNPTDRDTDYRQLRRLLGHHFDKNFMSTVRPLESVIRPNGTLDFKLKKGRPKERRPNFIKYFGSPVFTGVGSQSSKLRVSRRTRKKIQKYLWSSTHCPVFHTWKDLGVRFWPRWIKEGQCYKRKSCSIPPGMTCRPSGSTSKTILRWHCRDWQKNAVCRWIHINYPIITRCSCEC